MSAYGPPAAQRPPTSPAQRTAMLAYVAGGLGVLSFIWGFLDWFDQGNDGVGGYSVAGAGASAVIGFALAAGLLAVAGVVENGKIALAPLALGVTGLLLVIGVSIGKGNLGSNAGNVSMGIGLILALITAIVQVAVLVLAWMMAAGRMPAPKPKAPPGYPQPYPGQPGQYGPPPQAGYGPPPQPQPRPEGPGRYGPPPGQPGQYGPPSQPGPQGQPPHNPYGPPPQN
ncbi:MAG: DUF5336 domain-containing protein [Jatrophihabitantaceae bacterium]